MRLSAFMLRVLASAFYAAAGRSGGLGDLWDAARDLRREADSLEALS